MPAKTGKTTRSPEVLQDKIGLDRLIFFSDAVFAIAITLLSLDIRLPATQASLTDAELGRLLLEIWPKYMAYIISFLVIGLFWIGHHRKFRYIQKYNGNLLLLNLVLLMTIAFIPFPTSLISEYGNRASTIFYALVMVLTSLLSATMWWYAAYMKKLVDPNLDQPHRRRELIGPLLGAGVFLLSIGLAFFNVNLARLSWVLVAVTQPYYKFSQPEPQASSPHVE
jgi:TMEM175 potassium channel family protein